MATTSHTPKKQIFYVYVLLDTSKLGPFRYGHWMFDYEPFYVGKGHSSRFRAHTHSSRNPGVRNKIAKLRRSGLEHSVILKRESLNERQALNLERTLITKIGRRDLKEGPLFNFTDGGEQGPTGVRQGSKTRQKRSLSVQKSWSDLTDEDYYRRCDRMSESIANQKPKEKRRISKNKSEVTSRRFAIMTDNQMKEFKESISSASKRAWKNMSEKTLTERSAKCKQAWETMPRKKREDITRRRVAALKISMTHEKNAENSAKQIASRYRNKVFELYKSPKGRIYRVKNKKEFCLKHDLEYGAMCGLNTGRIAVYKGWMKA